MRCACVLHALPSAQWSCSVFIQNWNEFEWPWTGGGFELSGMKRAAGNCYSLVWICGAARVAFLRVTSPAAVLAVGRIRSPAGLLSDACNSGG